MKNWWDEAELATVASESASQPVHSFIPFFSSSTSRTTAQNKGQVIDAAMVDGCAYLGSFLLASRNLGIWTGEKEIAYSRLKLTNQRAAVVLK